MLPYAQLSANSRRAFDSDRRDYERWCRDAGRRPYPLGAPTVCRYLKALEARGLSPSTITRRVAGLRRLGLEVGGPASSMRAGYEPRVAATIDGIVERWTARVG